MTDKTRCLFRARLLDCDNLVYLHNAAYFSYMDMARWDFIVRAGWLKATYNNKWFTVVAGQKIFYKKSIRVFQKFSIDTKCIYWDEQWFYVRQIFRVGEDVAAIGYVRTRTKKRGGKAVPIKDILEATGQSAESPELEEDLKAWIEAEDKVKDVVLASSR